MVGLVAVAIFATVGDASAQKFPERGVTRQGTKLYDKGDFTGAEAKYRRALELNPNLREATFNLGNALWRQEKPEEAVKAYESIAADSLAPAPMLVAANYNIGNAALAGKEIDAAIEAYKRSLRIDPTDMEAKYNLAYAQALKQQEENKDKNNDKNNDQQDKDDQGGGQGDQNPDRKDQGDQGDKGEQGDKGDQNQEPNQGDKPQPSNPDQGQGGGQPKIDPRAAEQILDAMQAAEDDTRERVNAREVQAGARSGKNW
jgi:tetratricopeptide (TPR) repeat protein